MKIIVNDPAHGAHGRQFDAERTALEITFHNTFRGRALARKWRAADNPDAADLSRPVTLDCYVVRDGTFGRFAIPAALAVEIGGEAARSGAAA